MTEPALLIYGDTERSAALCHELPIAIGDPFLLGLIDGRMHVMTSSLERERVAAAPPGLLNPSEPERMFW